MRYTQDGIIVMRWGQGGLDELVEAVSNKVGRSDLLLVEVGSYQGESAEIFAKTGKVKEVWCIDPWKSGFDKTDPASKTDFAVVEREFDKRLAANPQMKKFKGTLDDFVKSEQFKDIEGKVDLIYIDACHTYDGCKHDIQTAITAVKPKIAYSGHDFHPRFSGVKNAVIEQFGNPDMVFADYSWIKFS